jgi:type II secretory pathway pseudopilin PulG
MKQHGFAMLEVVLSVVIVLVVSVGGVYLYQSGSDQTNLTSTSQELNSIAYTYSQLAANGLTADVADDEVALVALLEDSRQLSKGFFSVDESDVVTMQTPFGSLVFSEISPYAYTVTVGLGAMRTASQVASFYRAIEDNYTCDASCDAEADSVVLTFNMSN